MSGDEFLASNLESHLVRGWSSAESNSRRAQQRSRASKMGLRWFNVSRDYGIVYECIVL